MRILINGAEVNIPSSLSEITIGQRISFHEEHGLDLAEMAASINEMTDGEDKELELLEFTFEKMFRAFSFFSGCTVEALKESEFLDVIAATYYASLKHIFEDEMSAEMEPQKEFVWNGETWYLAPPELKHGDDMKFGELIDAKQMVQNMADLGKSNWDALLPLCAIYLRKKGEQYDKAFLYEGSDRLKLMEDLPLDIAFQVGFFLMRTVDIYLTTSQSLKQAESKPVENIQKTTSKDLVG